LGFRFHTHQSTHHNSCTDGIPIQTDKPLITLKSYQQIIHTYRYFFANLQITMASLAVNYSAALEPGTTALGAPVGSVIKVTIKNARDLRNKEQFGNKSDPYVSFSQFSGFALWGTTTQGESKQHCSGRWVESNLNPDWNQVSTLTSAFFFN